MMSSCRCSRLRVVLQLLLMWQQQLLSLLVAVRCAAVCGQWVAVVKSCRQRAGASTYVDGWLMNTRKADKS